MTVVSSEPHFRHCEARQYGPKQSLLLFIPQSAMIIKLLCAITLLASSAYAATFGDQNSYVSNFALKDNVAAFVASPSQSGLCDSITAYLKFSFDSCKVRCALYTISGNDTILVTNGVTEERRFAGNAAFVWQGFAFPNPKPSITAGGNYLIAVFGDSAGSGTLGAPRGASASGGGTLVSKIANYESGMPTPLNPSTNVISFRLSIYVTYTPDAPLAPRRRHITSRPRIAP